MNYKIISMTFRSVVPKESVFPCYPCPKPATELPKEPASEEEEKRAQILDLYAQLCNAKGHAVTSEPRHVLFLYQKYLEACPAKYASAIDSIARSYALQMDISEEDLGAATVKLRDGISVLSSQDRRFLYLSLSSHGHLFSLLVIPSDKKGRLRLVIVNLGDRPEEINSSLTLYDGNTRDIVTFLSNNLKLLCFDSPPTADIYAAFRTCEKLKNLPSIIRKVKARASQIMGNCVVINPFSAMELAHQYVLLGNALFTSGQTPPPKKKRRLEHVAQGTLPLYFTPETPLGSFMERLPDILKDLVHDDKIAHDAIDHRRWSIKKEISFSDLFTRKRPALRDTTNAISTSDLEQMRDTFLSSKRNKNEVIAQLDIIGENWREKDHVDEGYIAFLDNLPLQVELYIDQIEQRYGLWSMSQFGEYQQCVNDLLINIVAHFKDIQDSIRFLKKTFAYEGGNSNAKTYLATITTVEKEVSDVVQGLSLYDQ